MSPDPFVGGDSQGNVQKFILGEMPCDYFAFIPVTRSLGDSGGMMSRRGIVTGRKRCLHFPLNNMFTRDDIFRYVLLDKQRDMKIEDSCKSKHYHCHTPTNLF